MDQPAGSRLFVVCGHICEEDTLRRACSKFGPIKSLRCLREKGVAFVKYATKLEAARAMDALNGANLKEGHVNVQLKVMLADPADNGRASGVDSPSSDPYLQDPDNLPARSRLFLVVPRDADVHRIKQVMEAYEGMQYFRDEFAASKGVLYVKYKSAASAQKALEDIQAANCNLAGYRVKAMLADPKSSSRTTSAADEHGSHRGRWNSANGAVPTCRPASTGVASQKHGSGTNSPSWRPPFHELHSVPDPFLDLRCNSAPGPTPYPPPFLTSTPHPPHHPGAALAALTNQPQTYAMRTSASSGLGKYTHSSATPPALPRVPSHSSGELRWDPHPHRHLAERAPSLGSGRPSLDALSHPGSSHPGSSHPGSSHPGSGASAEAQRPDKVMRVASVGASSEGPVGLRSAFVNSDRYSSGAGGGGAAQSVQAYGSRGSEGMQAGAEGKQLQAGAEGRYRHATSSGADGPALEWDSSPEAEAIQSLQHALHQHYDGGFLPAQGAGVQGYMTGSTLGSHGGPPTHFGSVGCSSVVNFGGMGASYCEDAMRGAVPSDRWLSQAAASGSFGGGPGLEGLPGGLTNVRKSMQQLPPLLEGAAADDEDQSGSQPGMFPASPYCGQRNSSGHSSTTSILPAACRSMLYGAQGRPAPAPGASATPYGLSPAAVGAAASARDAPSSLAGSCPPAGKLGACATAGAHVSLPTGAAPLGLAGRPCSYVGQPNGLAVQQTAHAGLSGSCAGAPGGPATAAVACAPAAWVPTCVQTPDAEPVLPMGLVRVAGGSRKLLVRVPEGTGRGRIAETFGRIAGMQFCDIVTDSQSQIWSLVQYTAPEQADLACHAFNGSEDPHNPGSRLRVLTVADGIAAPSAPAAAAAPLCLPVIPASAAPPGLGGLRPGLSAGSPDVVFLRLSQPMPSYALSDLFHQFGEVVDVEISRNDPRHGAVQYKTAHQAAHARTAIHGYNLYGCVITCVPAPPAPSLSSPMCPAAPMCAG